jgi:hypothetical protein
MRGRGNTLDGCDVEDATVPELAQRLTISSQGDNFRVVLHGKSGGGVAGVLARAELQRILQMLQAEIAKAGWLVSDRLGR